MGKYLSWTQICTAAEWWGEKLRCGAKHDMGADSLAGFMSMMMADKMNKEQSDDKVTLFKDLLRKAMCEEEYVVLRCDYNPCELLATCAAKAEVPEGNFPWKTSMEFRGDEVYVSEGYGKDFELVQAVKTLAPLDKTAIEYLLKDCENRYGLKSGKFVVSYKAALVLQGLFETTKDIDMSLAKGETERIVAEKGYATMPATGYEGSTTKVKISDVMEAFDPASYDEVIKDETDLLSIDGVAYMHSPRVVLGLYERMNRPKDQETIMVIRKYLETEG